MVLEVHFETIHRAAIVRATILLTKVQLINVFVNWDGEPHILRVTLDWTVPLLLNTEMFSIYGGDFQANAGWDTSCPLASRAMSTTILHNFIDTPLRVVPKEHDMPTWILPQVSYGALNHFLIPEPSRYNAMVRVQATSSSPSDHTPTLLCIPDFAPINPPSALQHTGRITSPKVLSRAVKNRYQIPFDELFVTTAATLEDECQIF